MSVPPAAPGWVMEIEEIDIPGWFVVTDAVDESTQRDWVEQCASELGSLIGTNRWDGEPSTAEDLDEALRYALYERGGSDDDVILQVWPVPYLASMVCRLNLVTSNTLPDWKELGGIVHDITVPSLGSGSQVTIRRYDDDVEFISVYLIFDDGNSAFIMSLDDAPSLLTTRALPEFMMLAEVIGLVDSQGARFAGVGSGNEDEQPWPFDHEVQP